MVNWRSPPGCPCNIWLNNAREDANAIPLSMPWRSETAMDNARKCIQPIKTEHWYVGRVVICLELCISFSSGCHHLYHLLQQHNPECQDILVRAHTGCPGNCPIITLVGRLKLPIKCVMSIRRCRKIKAIQSIQVWFSSTIKHVPSLNS